MDALIQKIQATFANYPCKYSIYWVDMESGKEFLSVRPELTVVSASTIKVPVMLCALQEVMEGRLQLQQQVVISPEDFREDTVVFEPRYRKDTMSLWELLYWMIVLSDNTATNAILSLLSYEKINAYCRCLGLSSSSAARKMLDWDAIKEGRNNYTSARDQYLCYKALYHGEILTPELRSVALDFLGRSRDFGGLQRYIPDPVTVYHKPGGLDYLNHDAGVFLTKKPYYLGIFTWDGPSLDGDSEQNQLIGEISRMIYDYEKEMTV